MSEPAAVALVGRDTEQQQLLGWLSDGARLVSITGPVGVGKSALARSTYQCGLAQGVFESGARVGLDGVHDSQTLLAALDEGGVADALIDGQQPIGGGDSFLLVLDGCDAALLQLRALLPSWLDAHPNLSVLATSRELSNLPMERAQELAPLAVGAADFDGPAASLFLQCVRRSRPDYAPSAAELPVLAELLRELDGLPLAIEVSAARLAVMGAAALLHRVRQSKSGDKAPATGTHLRALDQALSSAWSALDADAQRALAQLTVFPGDFEFAAAEAVLVDCANALESVSTLRARSWLQAHSRQDGAVRLSLLSSVRQFALSRADRGSTELARQRHSAFFADYAEQYVSEADIALEQHNLDAVIESVLADGQPTRRQAEPALRVLAALYRSTARLPPLRHLAVLDHVLQRSRDSGADGTLICRALLATGSARLRSGDDARALRDLSQAHSLALSLNRSDLEGLARVGLSRTLQGQGESAPALQHAQDALTIATKIGDSDLEARALHVLGMVRADTGEDASAVFERAAALFDSRGDSAASQQVHVDWATTLLQRGQHEGAAAALHWGGETSALMTLRRDVATAMLAHDRGHDADPAQLQELAQRARALADATGESQVLLLCALVACGEKRFGDAHALLRTASLPSTRITRPGQAAQLLSVWLDERVLGKKQPAGSGQEKLADDFWLRALSRAIEPDAHAAPQPGADAVVVGHAGQWFRVPAGETVSLHRRRTLAAILDHLAHKREARPGEAQSWTTLQSAAWPGEKLQKAAGAHRVRVAVSSLRKLGLSQYLLTQGDGYLLTAEVPLFRDGKGHAQ